MKTKIHHLVSLFDIPPSISEDVRRQRLLDIIAGMIGIIAVILLIWAVVTWQIRSIGIYKDLQTLVSACIIMIASTIAILILNRFGSGYFARILFVALLLLLNLFNSTAQIADGRALLFFSIPIIAAAILIRPSASFLVAIISSVIVEIAAHSISPAPQPLPSIVVFFLLATFIWMATFSLERHIGKLREANAALKESEERYRSLVEISPDLVVLAEPDGKIIVVNQAGLALFGYVDAAQIVGKKVWELLTPEDRPDAITDFGWMVEHGAAAKVEYCALTKDGAPFLVELSASVLKDATGRPEAVIGVGRDITLRKKAEHALLAEKDETYRALVNNSAQGLVLLQKGRIILTNMAFANVIGLTPEEIYQLPDGKIFDFVHPTNRATAITNTQSRLAGNPSPTRYEIRFVHKNGSVRWLEMLPANITLDGIPTIQITTIDITERKLAEEATQAARDQLEAILNTLPDILFELDREQRFCGFRAMKSEAFFPSHEVVLGKTVMESIPSEAARIISAALDDALLNGQHRGATYDIDMHHHKYSFELSISTMGDMNLPSGRFIMLVRDVSSRKQAEDALRVSESKYRKLHESLMDGFIFVNMEGNIRDSNEAYQQMLGYSSEELTRLTYIDLTPDNWHAFEQKIVTEQILPRGYSDIYEKEYRKKDGTLFPVELRTFLIQNELGVNEGMWAIVRDITERKRAEETLRESEKRYRDLFENASLAVFQSGLDGQVIAVNHEFARIFGYQSPEDFKTIIMDAVEIFADPQRRAEIIRLRAENPGLDRFENVYRRKDGSTFLGQVTIKSITDEEGRLQCFEGFIEDITSRKQTEISLHESEERYRGLAEAAHDIIVIVTPDDRIEYANKFAAQSVGMTPEEIVGLPRSRFFPPAINERHRENLRKVFEHGLPMFTESWLPLPSGEIWLSSWMVPLKDESGAVKEILSISRNITERKALEEALIEAKNSLEQRVAERTADLINSREQLRRLTRQTVLAQENERRRLSRELHDETGQALIGLKFSLDEILAETPENLENTRKKITKTIARTDDLNYQIRNLAHGLHPPILDIAGIDLALNGFCREFSEETHLPVTYSGEDKLPALSEEINITLYRFVQEALTNVVKHAHASDAYVSLRHRADSITLCVKDNGTGFEANRTSKGIGLLGMEERLGLLGGRLEIRSSKRYGTQLKAVVPLTREVPGV